ncbi:uncharacterized protein AKAME5_001149200 [Lates japonicus]|uniref:Ig-like domain-containing protein n=1 Tax=Lates japonicus TaxID=270547 RepID=A0AAD3MTZ4_LATJO|nr:uncharacterized protein AKAME5_001149200 [Lates japonicus]
MMMSLTLLLATLGLLVQGSSGDIILTQSPGSQSVVPGQTVSIRCKASSYVGSEVDWYLLKPGEAPKLLIYWPNQATEILLIKNMTLISVLIWTLLCCCFTGKVQRIKLLSSINIRPSEMKPTKP